MISSRLPADRSFDRSKYTEQHDIVPGAVNGWFTVPGTFFLNKFTDRRISYLVLWTKILLIR